MGKGRNWWQGIIWGDSPRDGVPLLLARERRDLPDEQEPLVLPPCVVSGDRKRPRYPLPTDGQVLDAPVDKDCSIRRCDYQLGIRDDELVQIERGQEGDQDLLL